MQRGAVYCNGTLAGYIEKDERGVYRFIYQDDYYYDSETKPISLTLPKTQQEFSSNQLFSFFSGLLTEGINKNIQCRLLKIDENDDFTRLIKTAGEDTIGAITVKEI
ncbi:HipA-like protein [Pedobacter sp. UYP24]